MAPYNPPTEDLPIFDKNVFQQSEEYITQGDADKRYLRYPNAQGTENLAQINVNGAATFNAISSFKKTLSLNSTTASDRTINNTYYNLTDKTNNTTMGKIYGDNNDVFYDNDKNSGNHYFLNNTAGGVQTTTVQMNTTNFIINTTSLPTAPLASLPASTDSSTKIPTTAWVQSAISAGSSNTYTVKYTASTSFNTPSNCRFIDVCVVSRGGDCGASFPVDGTFGGSGSGGNMATCCGLMIGQSQTLTITVDNTNTSGYYEVKLGTITLCKVFNGNKGGDSLGGGGLGAGPNLTASITDNTFGNWITAFGRAGSDGSLSQPSTANSAMTPKNILSWNATYNGTGQRTQTNSTPTGIISITFHTV